MARDVLIVVRADVAPGVRAAVQNTLGFDITNWLAAEKYRRAGDAPGSFSHYVAHGPIPQNLWDDLVTILNTETQGVRDATDWQGNPGPIGDARWAVATDAGDVVAAYRMSRLDEQTFENPRQALDAYGLVAASLDADDGL